MEGVWRLFEKSPKIPQNFVNFLKSVRYRIKFYH